MRDADLRDGKIQVVGLRGQRLIAILECLGIVAGVLIYLRKLRIAVSHGVRVRGKLLHKLLQKGRALLRVFLCSHGLQELVFGCAGGNGYLLYLCRSECGSEQYENA